MDSISGNGQGSGSWIRKYFVPICNTEYCMHTTIGLGILSVRKILILTLNLLVCVTCDH